MSNKVMYAVVLMKTDAKHIILEYEGFEKAFSKWQEYTKSWSESIQEKKPLPIIEENSGIITAFDPALVYEIKISKKDISMNRGDNNPYYNDMLEKGFSESFKKTSNNNLELLDKGYKL